MDMQAPHFGFVAASYAISAALLVGLIAWIIWRDRALRAEAQRLDQRRKDAP
ncbi:heme exporter protein CcmD [Aestuariivirga sp.]|uniref:heme exporter protein CcmD n=1 Tax=Aestuariivirga sp. TaxID=2650926 RepID=UPI0039E5046B